MCKSVARLVRHCLNMDEKNFPPLALSLARKQAIFQSNKIQFVNFH